MKLATILKTKYADNELELEMLGTLLLTLLTFTAIGLMVWELVRLLTSL